MVRKGNKWTEVTLRQAIGEAVYSRHLSKKPIDREAIKSRYLQRCPQHSDFIKCFVDSYVNQLESSVTSSRASPLTSLPSGRSVCPNVTQSSSTPSVSQVKPPSANVPSSNHNARKIEAHHAQNKLNEDPRNSSLECSKSHRLTDHLINPRLEEFKKDLQGGIDKGVSESAPSLPSMEIQREFLRLDGNEDAGISIRKTELTKNAVLVSASLEDHGFTLPSQLALLGQINAPRENITDPRIMLNTNIPFSVFVCGVQGSGKSHTTACMIENCSVAHPALGNLQQSISTLVLHFDEYTSPVSSKPSEAAFLARILPQYAYGKSVPLRVLVSPTNLHNLKSLYEQIPNVEVRPFKIQTQHLNISMMLSLMSVSSGAGMPLYMSQVTRILRNMAVDSDGHFDYQNFRSRLNGLKLDRSQTPFLYQRLDLLDSYLDLSGEGNNEYFMDGGVTILDLSCPFVDPSTACVLFRIAIELFLCAHSARGKMVVADEAHKYMADSMAAKILTETFLTIIRQQRHLGVRVIISTQEPTISPRLIDLCSLTIIHRFTSPEWYKILQRHIPIECETSSQHCESASRVLSQIAGLKTGEAIVFAASARLVREDATFIDTACETFKILIRSRVTWDGGRSIMCIR